MFFAFIFKQEVMFYWTILTNGNDSLYAGIAMARHFMGHEGVLFCR
jgi:hypothetical protein